MVVALIALKVSWKYSEIIFVFGNHRWRINEILVNRINDKQEIVDIGEKFYQNLEACQQR